MDMSGHVSQSTYSKRLSRRQIWYDAHANWGVLDSVYTDATSQIRLNRLSVNLCQISLPTCSCTVQDEVEQRAGHLERTVTDRCDFEVNIMTMTVENVLLRH